MFRRAVSRLPTDEEHEILGSERKSDERYQSNPEAADGLAGHAGDRQRQRLLRGHWWRRLS